MNLGDVGRLARRGTKQHSSLLLSIAAGVGTLATSYLVGKASFEAAEVIRKAEERGGPAGDPKERFVERTKLVWKLYIPAAVSASSTIGLIAVSHRVELRKTLAAQAAFAVSERVYSEYRDKVIEEYGDRKDQSIRDSIAADRVKKTAPSQDIMLTGPGNVLCCELYTGRYFASDMPTLKRAVNEINHKLLMHDIQTFDDFYELVGLSRTTNSGNLGWMSSKLMDLQFSTVLTEDERPCLAFEYNYVEIV